MGRAALGGSTTMMRGRSYTRATLGPCAVCWREVKADEPCRWDAPRRTWQHCTC